MASCQFENTYDYVMNGPSSCKFDPVKKSYSCLDNEYKIYNKLTLTIIPNSNIINYMITPYQLSKKNIRYGTLNNCSIINNENFQCDELTITEGLASDNKIIEGLKIKKISLQETIKFWIESLNDKNYPDVETLGSFVFADNLFMEDNFDKKDFNTTILFRKNDDKDDGHIGIFYWYRTNLTNFKFYDTTLAPGKGNWKLENRSKDEYEISEDKSRITLIENINHEASKSYYLYTSGWSNFKKNDDPEGKYSMYLSVWNAANKKHDYLLDRQYYVHDCGNRIPEVEDMPKNHVFFEKYTTQSFESLANKYCN